MISIITPVYKGSQYFTALENMISQNVKMLHSKYPDVLVEFIIVNDYPQENISIEIFKRTAEYQAFLISPEKNGGVHSARVLGLKQARGKYILFLDQDDEIYTNFLLKQYELALHNKDADVIVCNAIKEMNGKRVLWYPNQIRLSFVTKPWIYLMVKNQIINESFHIFSGDIRDQQNVLRTPGGIPLSPPQIVRMDWLAANVEGRMPRPEDLTEEAAQMMAAQEIFLGKEGSP